MHICNQAGSNHKDTENKVDGACSNDGKQKTNKIISCKQVDRRMKMGRLSERYKN